LTRSYRYASDSGIAALAAAVRAGDVEAALHVLDDPTRADVALVDHVGGLSGPLRDDVEAGYADFLAAASPGDKLAAFDAFRVLCAHRQGPDGAEALNAAIEARLARTGGLAAAPGDYPGRPILVTRNDYDLGIYNGDVGVIERVGDGGLRAHFRAEGGELRWVSPLRLAAHESVFAMSVHKSQGSEFDRVAVVLPKAMTAVLSRELIYTAVSRARRSVHIHADRAVFAEAIAHRVERASGLRDLLWD
jgi:exodeoxyribonuclease V alpha subunit